MHSISLERVRVRFDPPPFKPSRLLCSGHLHTLWQLRPTGRELSGTIQHRVDLPDGDVIVLHDDCPETWPFDGLSILLVHGLGGDHASSYMRRLAGAFQAQNIRVFRVDMRGCGAAFNLSEQIMHAGRSDDVLAALTAINELAPLSSLAAMGFSLGGNQVLRAAGRVGNGDDPQPSWWRKLMFCAAVAPPINLERCSRQLLQWWLRPYNHHFINCLLRDAPPIIKQKSIIQEALIKRPRTMWEFDDRITAPLCGYERAIDYYNDTSANSVVRKITVPTLILAAEDDPIVPVGIFTEIEHELSKSTHLLTSRRGGHLGFVNRKGDSWMDEVILSWTQRHVSQQAHAQQAHSRSSKDARDRTALAY